MTTISSLSNQTIKDLVRLQKASERRTKGVFVIDGVREIDLAVKAGLEIISLFYCPKLIKKMNNRFFGLKNEQIIEVTETVFYKICYKENPEGFLAVAKQKELSLENVKVGKAPLVVVLESVEKPGNLGAIIRTSSAAGVELIIINDNQTDVYNPNVIRASEGLIFSQLIIKASVEETIAWLKNNRIKSFAAATSATKKYSQVDFKKASAIVLGSEAQGLSKKWLGAADSLVKIPMRAGIDSLNVSVSTAIIVYEALRQRDEKGVNRLI